MEILNIISLAIILIVSGESKPTDWFNRLQSDSHSFFGEREVTYDKIPNGCGGKPADVYFVFDTSDDVTSDDLQIQKEYASDLINLFYLEQDTVNVGVVSFGEKPKLVSRAGMFNKHYQLRDVIDNIPNVGGKRDTGEVLDYLDSKVFTDFGSRKDVGHFVIMLTNGNSVNSKMTSWNAKSLKRKGVYIFTVSTATKGDVDHREISSMASSPSERFIFTHKDLKIVESLISLLHIKECDYQVSPPCEDCGDKRKVCTASRPVDVIFGVEHLGLGSTHAGDIISFIYDILAEFDNSGEIQTAMMLSKSSGLNSVGKIGDIETLKNTISNIQLPNLADLLRRIRRNFSRGRKHVQKTAVVFIDENVEITKKAKIEAKRNKYLKIETYVIYIGDKNNMKNVKYIANGYGGNNIMVIPSYDDLLVQKLEILQTICQGF